LEAKEEERDESKDKKRGRNGSKKTHVKARVKNSERWKLRGNSTNRGEYSSCADDDEDSVCLQS
jgi:hypothetical protein